MHLGLRASKGPSTPRTAGTWSSSSSTVGTTMYGPSWYSAPTYPSPEHPLRAPSAPIAKRERALARPRRDNELSELELVRT